MDSTCGRQILTFHLSLPAHSFPSRRRLFSVYLFGLFVESICSDLLKISTDLFGLSPPIGLSVSNALDLCSPKIKVSY